jgi:hypothetical protein
MHIKQIVSLFISLVFFAATGWLIYNQFSGRSTPPELTKTNEVTAPGARLLPLGSSLDFSVINSYNGGVIQPFPYPVVQENEVSVQKSDLIKKASE